MPKPLSVGPGTTIGPEHLPAFLQPDALRGLVLGVLTDPDTGSLPAAPAPDLPLDLTLLAEAASS